MSMRISLTSPETDASPTAWDDLLAVLAGTLRPPLDERSLKLLQLMTATPADVRLRPSCFELWPMRGGRQQYLSELAAPVVHQLMRRLGLSHAQDARVGLLERVGLGASFGKPALRAVWIVPSQDEVAILLREAAALRGPRVGVPVPAGGPWALPPMYQHPEPEWLPAQRACPRCKGSPPYFRRLGSAWVCPECGRSFELASSRRSPA